MSFGTVSSPPSAPSVDERTLVRRRIIKWAKETREKVGDNSFHGVLNLLMTHIGGPSTVGSMLIYKNGQTQESLRKELLDMMCGGEAEGWL